MLRRRLQEVFPVHPIARMFLVHPFELLIAIWSLLSGIPISLGVRLSSNASAHLPGALYNAWGVMLICSGATILSGLVLFFASRNSVRKIAALRIEQGGWSLLCCGVGVFTGIIAAQASAGSAYVVMADAAVVGAGILRIVSLGQAAKAYKRVLRDVISNH